MPVRFHRFRKKEAEGEALRLSDEAVVDIAPDGTIYGIELLSASERLRREDAAGLVIVNEATGEQMELPLPIREPE